jgi:FixJ family two-component response regulator
MVEQVRQLISIVDDDECVCEAVTSLLKANGLTCKCFSSATEFLNSPNLEQTGCLILDLCLSDMSGLELQRHLAGRIQVIFVTSHGTPENREEAMRAGAVAFLSKPFSEDALLNSIHRALGNGANAEERK